MQTSILKAILKWRDHVARVEDESHHYIMPNHVLFSVASYMPTTRNEFRDCCRSNYNSMLLKYQDEIIALVNKKIVSTKEKSKNKKNHHIKFDDTKAKPSSNPEFANQEIEEPAIKPILVDPTAAGVLSIENGHLPEFTVAV